MALVRIEVSEGEVKTLRELVEGALRVDIEGLRKGELARHKMGTLEDAPERILAFYQEALDVLGSELAGLYRLFVLEEAEAPLEGPGEATEDVSGGSG